MKIVYVILYIMFSGPAFACSGSISPSDLALIQAKTPPPAGIRIDCSGVTCICIPDDEFLNTDTATYFTVDNVNKILVADATKKATLLAQYKAASDARIPNKAALDALRTKISDGTITAAQVVLYLKLKEGL